MSKDQAQEQLQNALTTTFLANLAFLCEYDNNLYLKVDELSKMINEGIYKEKYQLEFIETEGDFDIYDHKNKRYLYNKKPKSWNDKIVNSFQLDEKNSILTLEENLYSGRTIGMDMSVKYHLENLKDGNDLTLNQVSEYVNIIKNDSRKKKLKKLKKVIFLGSLLGRHIHRIATKFESDIYVLAESNLEIFRLSLFVTDYSILARNTGVIFSIMEDSYTFEKKIVNFLQVNPFDNYLIKLSTTDFNIKEYLDSTLSAVLNTKPSSFDYNRILYSFVRNVSLQFNNSNNILLTKRLSDEFTLLNTVPILFIGAGPSLDENIDWIRDNQYKFYIVTIGSSVKKLLLNKIKIDMIFTLDPQYDTLNNIQFDDETVKLLDNTIIMASIITDNRIINKFKKENIFIYEVFHNFHKENNIYSVSSVGEQSIALLLEMNVKELYLVGLDFALNQDTGNTHSSGTSGITKFDLKKKNIVNNREIYGLRTRTFEVKGNLLKKVYTTGVYSGSIYALNNIFSDINKDVNIYNLSKHGAAFVNTIPIKQKDIIISNSLLCKIDKNKVIKSLLKNSVRSLPSNEINILENEVKYIKQVMKEEIFRIKEKKFNSYDMFYINVINMLVKLTTFRDGSDILTIMINNHTQILFNYFGSYFNDVKVKNEDKKVDKIKIIYTRQLEDLLTDYINYLIKIINYK